MNRRNLISLGAGALAACAFQRKPTSSRLAARPAAPTERIERGSHRLGLGSGGRDGVLIVPRDYDSSRPAPFALLLHGATGHGERVARLLGAAETFGIVVLAPDSRGTTWDVIQDGFGPDVEFIDRALAYAFARCAVDPRHLAIGGFSDGASYALSLGLDNGDLFTHVLAFSPGFFAGRQPNGQPRLFVSHGRQDEILPIARTSRRLVPALEQAGYSVTYREFDGPHAVPPSIASDAFTWFTH